MQGLMNDSAFLTAMATLVTAALTLIAVLVKWWTDRGDKKEIKKGVENVATVAAESHKEIIDELKVNTTKTEQGCARADKAFTEANNFNLKLLTQKKEIAELAAEVVTLRAAIAAAEKLAQIDATTTDTNKTLHEAVDTPGAQ